MRTTADLVRALEATRTDTLEFFTLGPDQLARTYAPGKWSVRYVLHHLADAECVLLERIRRVICEPPQTLLVFDQDAWAAGLDYARYPLPLSRDGFDAARRAAIHLAGLYYESHGHLTFIHSTMGRRTLRQEFDKVADHCAHHLDQIRSALAAPRSGVSA